MNDILKKSLYEICDEEEILITTFSKDWIFRLEKNNKIIFITGFKFPNNNLASADICNDKVALCEVFKKSNIPYVEHIPMFVNDYQNIEDKFFLNLFEKYGNLLVKDNRGSCGKNIYKCDNINTLREKLEKLFLNNYLVAISPFFNIEVEYRLIMLDGEMQIIYGKKIKTVTGDGISTIRDLCLEKSIDTKYLDEEFLNLVLTKDTVQKLDFQHNLSRYGEYFYLNDMALEKELFALAKKVTECLGINFASVDIVKIDDTYRVLEVNSGVMMESYGSLENFEKAKEVYRKAVLKNFL